MTPVETLPNAFARLDARTGWQGLPGLEPEGLVFDDGAVMLGEPGQPLPPGPRIEPRESVGQSFSRRHRPP